MNAALISTTLAAMMALSGLNAPKTPAPQPAAWSQTVDQTQLPATNAL
jgi:hypothetical protein